MFTKISSFGALLALVVSTGSVSAKPSETASCCVEKTRCCSTAKYCCDQPEKAACCKTGTSCCDKVDCCGPTKKTAISVWPVTGLIRSECCASKAVPSPPYYQKGCDTPDVILR